MALIPVTKGQVFSQPKSQGILKPVVPKRPAVQPAKQDIRQSKNYLNAVSNANKYAQEASQANSFGGMTVNALKAAPQAALDTLVGAPIKFGASVAEIPSIVNNQQYTEKTYKIPGLSPFQSLQSDYGKVAEDVVAGRKGLGSAAWSLAQVPLSGMQAGILGGGIAKGIRALASGNVKQAAGAVSDAILPTNFSQEKVLAPVVPKVQKINTPQSPLLSEARKYKSAEEFVKAQGDGTKPSGIINTIRNSTEYSQDMAKNLEGAGGYTTRKQEPLVKEAQKTIVKNFSEAERIATTESSDRATIMADQLSKHLDTIAQDAKARGDTATFDFAMGKAKQIALQVDVNLRESGRAIAAANQFNKQSPEGMLRTLVNIAEQKGTKLNLSNEQVFNFQRDAEKIGMIADPKQRALKTFELMDEVYDSVPSGAKDKLFQALNLPRAIMATADLSAPLRQGIFTAARNPKTFSKNFGNMFKYAFSENAYRNLKADIVTSPNYNLYVKYKLPLTDLTQGITTREEQFMSNWAEKIPLFGKLSKGSNRAYSGFLNKMRVDLFDDFVNTAKLNGITEPKFFEDAARFVGSATGRGNIHQLLGGEQTAKVLNSFFFSPRLMSSRFSLMNPAYYAKLHPSVRKEALKSLAAFVGTGTGILALAKLNGAEVGTDPRSADFGKIKVGNTRYDTWGGFQQYAKLIGQLTTGEMVSTVTGKETQLGEGYNAPTRLDIIARFFQSKENPLASFLTTVITGKTMLGDKANIPAEVIDRFIPMLAQDAADLMKEYGIAQGAAMAIPGAFGIGSQTYGSQIPMMSKTASGNPSVQWRQQPNIGESLLNAITGNELSNIPKEQWQPLADERLTEQKRQIELTKAKSDVLLTGEPKYVGDTFIFLDNGVVRTKQIKVTPRTPLQTELKKNNSFYTK